MNWFAIKEMFRDNQPAEVLRGLLEKCLGKELLAYEMESGEDYSLVRMVFSGDEVIDIKFTKTRVLVSNGTAICSEQFWVDRREGEVANE